MIQPTFGQVLREMRKMFTAARFSSPELEARLLVEKAAGKSREELLRDLTALADDDTLERLRGFASRRLDGEPVAYITGEWEFYSLPLRVTRATLIPRADSEVLAHRAIELLVGRGTPRVLDLCAGTGCIGLAVAANVREASVKLCDISESALEVCRENIRLNGLDARVAVECADALEAPTEAQGTFDMIICNPPYIPSNDLAALDRSVRDFEPLSALDGGADGLSFYRAVTRDWSRALQSGGYLLFECGRGQAVQVRDILEGNGFEHVETVNDTAGIPRVVIGIKK